MGCLILKGHNKTVLKEVIRYYVETTENEYEDFIKDVQKTRGDLANATTYHEWLATTSYHLLNKYNISISDCIENKDVIRAAIKESESRQNGEFYTPEIWCKDGREYLKDMLGDQWGEAYIWDASCGTGNLLKSIDYPMDKIFMSSLLPEDVDMVKSILPDVEAFQLDFVNGVDYDENNMFFSQNLPPRLIEVLKSNQPIVFYMNPPYKTMEAQSSDVGAYMSSHGMTKSALDIFHQFMFRIVMIKRTYNLTNLYMGIFGPVTMFHSKMIEPMYNEFKKEFLFHDGMCFDAGDFSNTSESVGWVVGYTAWRSKQEGEVDKSVVLTSKAIGDNDEIKVLGSKLIKSVDINLHEWALPKDIVRSDVPLPVVTTFNSFKDTLMKAPEHYLGYMMSANFVIRATRRACVTSLPNPDNVAITPENFWRCVASFSARRVYATNNNPYNNCQYYNMPDTSIEGYGNWLADALMIFLFDYSAHEGAYRNVEQDGVKYTISNRLFPIDAEQLKQVITDPVILHDMEENPAQNQFVLQALAQVLPHISDEARELYTHCMTGIVTSLHGETRKSLEYANHTRAWDAGLCQIRLTKGLLPEGFETQYSYLLSRLKTKLYDGVYRYGFMMDAISDTEDAPSPTVEDDEPDLDVVEDEIEAINMGVQ